MLLLLFTHCFSILKWQCGEEKGRDDVDDAMRNDDDGDGDGSKQFD